VETITITVSVAKVQTMADGGKRYTFDGMETESYEAAQLMECQRLMVAGRLTFEPIETSNGDDGEKNENRSY
jgi:hypothetical protein